MGSLVRSSFKPLYHQLTENLRALIEDSLKPDEKLPSENDLIVQYNVSRNTVRMALDALTKQGLIYRIQGKGSYVAPERMRYGLVYLTGFTEEMRRRGLNPSSRILSFERRPANAKEMKKLELSQPKDVFVIERLRMANEKPMALSISCIPTTFCENLDQEDLSRGSLYSLLEDRLGYKISHADETLKPTLASEYEAEVLEIKVNSPLLLVEGITRLEGGTPVEYFKLIYRGDKYEFSVQALRQ